MSVEITNKCPECGCEDYINKNLVGDGFRQCSSCGQEWWTDVDYLTGWKDVKR